MTATMLSTREKSLQQRRFRKKDLQQQGSLAKQLYNHRAFWQSPKKKALQQCGLFAKETICVERDVPHHMFQPLFCKKNPTTTWFFGKRTPQQ